MKKIKFLLGLVSLFTGLFSASSCKKSYECCMAGYCETVSQSRFPSRNSFTSYIKYLEQQGYTCK